MKKEKEIFHEWMVDIETNKLVNIEILDDDKEKKLVIFINREPRFEKKINHEHEANGNQ